MDEEKISKEDLDLLAAHRSICQNKLLEAQKVIAENKAAELEYKNQILRLFVKYSMKLDDGFDDMTGVITREKKSEEVEEEHVEKTDI